MTGRLTWLELSALSPGTTVAFDVQYGAHSKGDFIDVPRGTVCEIVENSIYRNYGGVLVRPVNLRDREQLVYAQEAHNGCILLDEGFPEALSPFTIAEVLADVELI